MSKANIVIGVKSSPDLKDIVSGLRAAEDLIELIPEWHAMETEAARRKLRRAANTLARLLTTTNPQ